MGLPAEGVNDGGALSGGGCGQRDAAQAEQILQEGGDRVRRAWGDDGAFGGGGGGDGEALLAGGGLDEQRAVAEPKRWPSIDISATVTAATAASRLSAARRGGIVAISVFMLSVDSSDSTP